MIDINNIPNEWRVDMRVYGPGYALTLNGKDILYTNFPQELVAARSKIIEVQTAQLVANTANDKLKKAVANLNRGIETRKWGSV